MPALKSYGDFYEVGSAVRKKEIDFDVKKEKTSNKTSSKRQYGKNKISSQSKKIQAKKRKNTLVVAFVLIMFSMTMVITYRYNVITEKNLEVQKLKKSLATVEGTLLNKQIEIEQQTDLNKIESYAKQQLGMQKPDKSQTVYIDTSKTIQMVEIGDDKRAVENIINKVKSFIDSIF